MGEITRAGVDLAKRVIQVHAVSGEERLVTAKAMARESVVEVEAAEPSIRQIQADLLAQPPLGSNAEAVAD